MGFLGNLFSNPLKTIADVSTGGLTLAARAAFGENSFAGQASNVIGSSVEGFGIGYVTGGPAGAAAGGTAGFARGVEGVAAGDSGSNIAGSTGIISAITGSILGFAKGFYLGAQGTGATVFGGANSAGVVGAGTNYVYGDIAGKTLTTPGATTSFSSLPIPPVAATAKASAGTGLGGIFSGFGTAFGNLATVKLLSGLQGIPNLPKAPTGGSGVNLQGPGIASASKAPIVYPGVPGSLTTVSPGGTGVIAPAPKPTNWLLYIGLAVVAFLFFSKKKFHF